METVSVGFSYHRHNLLSNTIKLIDGCPYSHVYIRRKSKYGEYVYQASGLAVNFMNIDIFLESNVIVEEYAFDLDDSKREKLMTFFIKYAGCGYELASLFKILAMMLASRVDWHLEFKGDGEGQGSKFICSELGAFFCKEILEIPVPSDINFISPKQLNPIVKQYGRRVV